MPRGSAEYTGLLGENYSGNVFIVKYNGRLVACMSRHQFDSGQVPTKATQIEPDRDIRLNRSRVFKQKDVQILPLTNQEQNIEYLAYKSNYELKANERLFMAPKELEYRQ